MKRKLIFLGKTNIPQSEYIYIYAFNFSKNIPYFFIKLFLIDQNTLLIYIYYCLSDLEKKLKNIL